MCARACLRVLARVHYHPACVNTRVGPGVLKIMEKPIKSLSCARRRRDTRERARARAAKSQRSPDVISATCVATLVVDCEYAPRWPSRLDRISRLQSNRKGGEKARTLFHARECDWRATIIMTAREYMRAYVRACAREALHQLGRP